jgi:hypothetical protein
MQMMKPNQRRFRSCHSGGRLRPGREGNLMGARWGYALKIVAIVAFMVVGKAPAWAQSGPKDYFGIQVIDESTGRGVPLVELKTVNGIRYVTDSNGLVAFYEPGLMNRDVFFHVRSHGYDYPADGFGFRGKSLRTTPGTIETLPIRRVNLAERLYRITGEGIYRDSLLLGRPVPIQHPVINAGVLGSDSVLSAAFRGKLYWFWGDTLLPGYPLGLFHTPGATSPLPGPETLPASQGIELTYFTDDSGTAINTARLPGAGPTWLSGLTVLRDETGNERLFAGYSKINPPLETYERGIVEFNPDTELFEHRAKFPLVGAPFPEGHPVYQREKNPEYIYFARPFPDVRVRATAVDFLNSASYETYTCLAPGSTEENPHIERDESGRVVWSWRKGGLPRTWQLEKKLLERQLIRPRELAFQLMDVETGKSIMAHSGSIAWNEYCQRYVLIALEVNGTSPLGEVWYAEARDLMGPWGPARKIVTHENQSFYNPLQHPLLAESGGQIIYFEGTYTSSFTGNPDATPRYEYNQIMYRLDLGNEQLHLTRD